MKKIIQLMGLILCSGFYSTFAGTSGPLTYEVVDGDKIRITDCLTSASGTVSIPATLEGMPVMYIGNSAFYDCSQITKIVIPESVVLIDASAFMNCTGLSYVFFPESLTTTIWSSAFKNCTNLKRAIFKGNAPSSFGSDVFLNTATGFMIYYGDDATGFSNPWNGYTTGTYNHKFSFNILSGSPETIEISDYPESEVGEVDIPSTLVGLSVTKIGNNAFDGCTQLSRITLPTSITHIGDDAFSECGSLSTFTVPASVIFVGDYAFADCGLSSIFFEGDAPQGGGSDIFDGYNLDLYIRQGAQDFSSEVPWKYYSPEEYTGLYDFVVYREEIKITGYPDSATGGITIPETIVGKPVTRIGEDAFYYCDALTRISLPDSLEFIYPTAFEYCSDLTTLTIPTNVTYIGNGAYGGCALDSVFFEGNAPSTMGFSALGSTNGLTVYYKDGNTGFTTPTWNGYATEAYTNLFEFNVVNEEIRITDFPYSVHTSVVLPAEIVGKPVTTIGYRAFAVCTFPDIDLPDTLTTIEDDAFKQSSLESITIPAAVTSITSTSFDICDSLAFIEVETANTTYSSSNGVLFNKTKTELCKYPNAKTATDYEVPNTVVTICDKAFQNCDNLYSVIFPEVLTSINSVFSAPLQAAVFLGNAPTLSSIACFSSALDDFKIYYPEGKTGFTPTLEDYPTESYDGNFSFKIHSIYHYNPTGSSTVDQSIEITDYPKTVVGNFVLPNTLIHRPIETIATSVFQNCAQLTSVTFPTSITDIGDFAFENCPLLKTAIFHGDAPALGSSFYGEFPSLYEKTSVFDQADPNFMIYYFSDHSGFSSPTWEGYPATEIDRAIYPAGEWLLSYDLPFDTNLNTDVSGDGVDLLMEYALDLIPSEDNSGNTPKIETSGSEIAINFNAAREDVTYTVDQSTNLQTWTTNGVFYSTVSNNILRAITLKDDNKPVRFLRLRVETAAP